MEQDLLDLIKDRKVTFFVGAGISMIPPACLPSWWQINHAILDALASDASELVTGSRELAELIKKREEDGKLPPEFVAEIITNRIGKSYFDVLQCLEGDKPNKVHLWLATLAKTGILNAIITTNFDTLIERAFNALGVPLTVLLEPQDFQPDQLQASQDRCLLLKLHGTASRPDSCVDTLAQRKKGFPPHVLAMLESLGISSTWLFLGYSGADLDAEPNYLGIRSRIDRSPGFYWLQLPGKEPLTAVSDLVNAYGEAKAKLPVGELPAWLDDLNDILQDGNSASKKVAAPKDSPLKPKQVAQIREKSARKIQAATKKWADKQGAAVCNIILGDIAISAGFRQETETMLRQLIDRQDKITLTDFGFGLLYQELGEILKHFGKNKEALDYYQKSYAHFQGARAHEGMLQSSQNAAQILLSLGYYGEAENLFKGYLDYSRQRDDPEDYVHALLNMGSFYMETGKYDQCLAIINEAIPIAIKNGLELLKAHSLLGRAEVEIDFGQQDKAIEDISEALAVYSRLGSQAYESEALRFLAQLALKQGKIQAGLEKLAEAKEKASMIGNKSRMLRADQIKGEYLLQSGNYLEAEGILRETAQQAEVIGNFNLAIAVWQSAGEALRSQANYEAAQEILQKILTLAEDHELEVKAAGIKVNLGIVAEQKGDLDTALEYYEHALVIFERCQNVDALAGAKGNIANIYFRQGKFAEAKNAYEETLALFEQLNYIDGILRTLYNIANVTYQLGDIDQAKDFYARAIQRAEEFQQAGLRDNFRLNYANVLFQLKELEEAFSLYEATYTSCSERQDYYLAGLASYYASLIQMQFQDKDAAAQLVQQALTAWDQLNEQPSQYAEAAAFLQNLT